MAIVKKLIYFKTQADFEKALEAGQVQQFELVFIKENQRLWTQGTYFSSLNEVYEDLSTKADQSDLESISKTVDSLDDTISSLSNAVDTNTNDITELSNSKQNKLIAGTAIEITSDDIINCTIDNNPFIFCEELPTTDIKEGKVYCIPNEESTEENNIWDEYYYVNDKWELMGQYIPKVDLTPYDKIEDREALIESSEDDEYVVKHIDSEGNVLAGIKSNGEVYIPIGVSDDTYTLIENLYEKLRDCVNYVSDLNVSSDVSNLIYSDTDEEFVLKAIDKNTETLIGFKESGEVYVPTGITDGAYELIKVLYEKLNSVIPAIREYCYEFIEEYSNNSFDKLINTTEDDEYVIKVQDHVGELLGAFTTTGEVKIPTGVTDDTYELINLVYHKLASISEYLKELQAKIDKLEI